MPQITIRHRITLVMALASLAILAGCGTPNEEAPFNVDTQKHASDWLPARHVGYATTDIASCRSCHGQDLLGGISGSTCTSCHIGGPISAHPATWVDLTFHGPYVSQNGAASCRNIYCHGAELEGINLSGPACSTCH